MPRGFRPQGIRIDSGDIAYLSIESRKMLDEAGFQDCRIIASNSFDENVIRDVLQQGARIDSFGVGERLITSQSDPIFGGVYKLVAIEEGGQIIPKIKLSENVEKITNPGFKHVWRFYDNASGKAIADLITLDGEKIEQGKPYEIFNPDFNWKRKTLRDFSIKELLVPLFRSGRCVYKSPDVGSIAAYCREQIGMLWEEVLRFEKPHRYYVDLSFPLWELKKDLIKQEAGV